MRWADGSTYVCPWQTRLRSWLALGRLDCTAKHLLAAGVGPGQAERAAADLASWRGEREGPARVYIQNRSWAVPLAWFVPFAPAERWLVLGTRGNSGSTGRATAAGTRTLIYATAMSQARRRVARALAAIRRVPGGAEPDRCAPATAAMIRAGADLEEIGRWLEEFHPHSLVELDYGGLVQLLDDDALRADQSVAEVSAAVSALAGKEFELAAAMYQRLRTRWRDIEAAELSS